MPITQERVISLLETIAAAIGQLESIQGTCDAAALHNITNINRVLASIKYAKQSESLKIVRDTLIDAERVMFTMSADFGNTIANIKLKCIIPREIHDKYFEEKTHFKFARKKNEAARRYQEKLRRRRGTLTREEHDQRIAAHVDMNEILAENEAAEEIWPELDANGNVIRTD